MAPAAEVIAAQPVVTEPFAGFNETLQPAANNTVYFTMKVSSSANCISRGCDTLIQISFMLLSNMPYQGIDSIATHCVLPPNFRIYDNAKQQQICLSSKDCLLSEPMLQDAFGNAITSVPQGTLFLSFDSLSYIGNIRQDILGLFAATFMPNLIDQVTPAVLIQHHLTHWQEGSLTETIVLLP